MQPTIRHSIRRRSGPNNRDRSGRIGRTDRRDSTDLDLGYGLAGHTRRRIGLLGDVRTS